MCNGAKKFTPDSSIQSLTSADDHQYASSMRLSQTNAFTVTNDRSWYHYHTGLLRKGKIEYTGSTYMGGNSFAQM